MRAVVLSLFSVVCLLGCHSHTFFSGKREGIVLYDVTFPFERNSLMMELYPKEMTLEFKGDLMRATLKSAYGVIATDFIIDNDNGNFVQMLKSFSDKSYTRVTRPNMPAWLSQFPDMRIEHTGIIDTLAGYPCRKYIAHFLTDSLPAIELFVTDRMKVDPSNWWNQFYEVDGFLMGYEIEQYGKRMKIMAREVRFGPVADERFEIPTDYLQIAPDQMRKKIKDMLADFVN